MKRVMYIDIDGVLARHNLAALMSTFNQQWQLGIPEEQLAHIETEDAFHALPEAQAHQARIGEREYELRRKWMRFDPLYVYEKRLIQGAREGVARLAECADELAYCTARVITIHEQWNAHLASVTRSWLRRHEFAQGEVLFCDGIRAKWERIAERVRQEPCRAFLIDDSLALLVEAWGELPETEQLLLWGHCTLIAFRYEACERPTPLRVLPAPGWQEVTRVMEKEFQEYDRRKRPL